VEENILNSHICGTSILLYV